MKYIAVVRDKETREIKIFEEMEYLTKKAFADDLRGNGYAVRFITTEDKFDEDCVKYDERVKETAARNKAIREYEKRHANEMGMTVKEYKFWLKTGIYPDGYFEDKEVEEEMVETETSYVNDEGNTVKVMDVSVAFEGCVPKEIRLVSNGIACKAPLKQVYLSQSTAEYRADRKYYENGLNLFRVICEYGKEPCIIIFDYKTRKYINVPFEATMEVKQWE